MGLRERIRRLNISKHIVALHDVCAEICDCKECWDPVGRTVLCKPASCICLEDVSKDGFSLNFFLTDEQIDKISSIVAPYGYRCSVEDKEEGIRILSCIKRR